jgi:hypothetical protein
MIGRHPDHDRIGYFSGIIEHPACYCIMAHTAYTGGIFYTISAAVYIPMISHPAVLQVFSGGFYSDHGRIIRHYRFEIPFPFQQKKNSRYAWKLLKINFFCIFSSLENEVKYVSHD